MRRILVTIVMLSALLMSVFFPLTTQAAEKKIAIMSVGPSLLAKENLMGFLPRLREIAPDVKVTLKMEMANMGDAEKVFREFESNMDGIVFLRSNGTEFLAKTNPKIPCFVGTGTNPKFLGAIQNLESPEGNITGVTYYFPYERHFDTIKKLFPNVKSVVLLMDKSHPSVPVEQKETREQCEKAGIEYNEILATNGADLLQQVGQLADKVNLFIIANHDMVVRETPKLREIGHAKKIPIYSYADVPLKLGAAVGTLAREKTLGGMLADSVVDVVVKGKPVSQVPVKFDPEPQVTINETEMDFFGFKAPPSILTKARIIRPE